MFKKLRKTLYNVSRVAGKTSSILGDIDAIASGNPKKIGKRIKSKVKSKAIYGIANKVNKGIK